MTTRGAMNVMKYVCTQGGLQHQISLRIIVSVLPLIAVRVLFSSGEIIVTVHV